MEQTAEKKAAQKTVEISAKKKNEIKISNKIAEKIKGQWDELAKRQNNSGVRLRSSRKITSVSLVKDSQGKIAVQVNLRNGRSITDNGREKALDTFKKQSRRAYARARIAEFLKRIREDGFAAVEGDIPAELKDAVLSAMSKANISTSYRGAKAEAAEAKQASQRAARAAEDAMKGAAASSGFGVAAAVAGLGIAATVIPQDRLAKRSGSELIGQAKQGEWAPRIKITPAMEKGLARGIETVLPPVSDSIPVSDRPVIEKALGMKTDLMYQAAEKIPDAKVMVPSDPCTNSGAAIKKDGSKVKADITTLASKSLLQNVVLEAFDRAAKGEATEADKGILETQMSVLKHNSVVPRETKVEDLSPKQIADCREYISQNAGQLKEKGIKQFLSPDQLKEYEDCKETEKALRSNRENSSELIALQSRAKSIIAGTPTLLSEIRSGEKKPEDHTFEEISSDKRAHGKVQEQDEYMVRTLSLLRKRDNLPTHAKVTPELWQETVQLHAEFEKERHTNPGLTHTEYLKRIGLIQASSRKTERSAEGKTSERSVPATKESASERSVEEKRAAIEKNKKETLEMRSPAQSEAKRVADKMKEVMETLQPSKKEEKEIAPALKGTKQKQGLQQKLTEAAKKNGTPSLQITAPQIAAKKKGENLAR